MWTSEKARFGIAVCVFILALCPAGIARIIYVDNDGSADFNTIQAAIDDANDGDTVIIQPGTYTGPGNRDISIKNRVVIVQSVDPNDPNVVAATVVDCEGTESDPHTGFFLWSYQDLPDSVLAGLTIIHGYAQVDGGGILCSGYASATIRNCRLIGNHATRGGGILLEGNASQVLNCILMGNSVSNPRLPYAAVGGGMFCNGNGPMTISGCLIVGNSASGSSTSPGTGGGLYLSRGPISVRHCTVVGNIADLGGGISCDESTAIADCIVWSNSAPTSPQIRGTPLVTYSDIEGGWSGLGNTQTDPLFVDPASNDYHLSASSPCIHAGDPQYVPYVGQRDIDNEPRVMGRCVDMGTDEFASTPTAVLDVYPKQLVFHADVNGSAPESQTLHISNAGYAPLVWTVACDGAWLGVSENSPRLPDGGQTVSLSVDMAGLGPGRHDCQVTVSADHVPNSPQPVTVSLYVRAGTHLYVPQPYGTIQSAIEAAEDGDTVIIETGTYTGPGNRDIDFLGKRICVRSVDPNDPAVVAATVIDCGGTEVERHRAFVFHSGEDANAVLSGLTITKGWALQGAGIHITGSSPTILCCNITGNTCASSDPREVYARKDGGGIYIRDGSPHVERCVITHNRCDGYMTHGGGVFCYDASPVLRDCCIKSNMVRDGGGGIHGEHGGNVTLSGCTIAGNWTTFRIGGGVCLRSANGMLSHCLIAGNQSNDGGGGLFLERSETTIRNCTIAGNADALVGGGVDFSLGKLLLVDTILWANKATYGPQIDVYSWIGLYDAPWSLFKLTGTVDIRTCDIEGGLSKVYISGDPRCLQFNWGAGNVDADPLFADSAHGDYQLKSQTGRWEPGGGTWVIDEVTSPCIDAGDPNSPVGDEPEPNGGRINMGAYGGTAEASKSYRGG